MLHQQGKDNHSNVFSTFFCNKIVIKFVSSCPIHQKYSFNEIL